MRRLFIIIAIFTICLFSFGCNQTECDGCFGNQTTFDFTKTYEHAYVKIGEKWTVVDVKQWNDYEGEQIQIVLQDGTVLLFSSVNCILFSGELPTVE